MKINWSEDRSDFYQIFFYLRLVKNNGWLVGHIFRHINPCWLFNSKSSLYKHILHQVISPNTWDCRICWKHFYRMVISWLVVWVLWHINLCRLFNAKSIFIKIVLFQTIQFRISTQFKCKYSWIVKNSISCYSV